MDSEGEYTVLKSDAYTGKKIKRKKELLLSYNPTTKAANIQ